MKPDIVPVDWHAVEAWLRSLATKVTDIDYILGVARSGAPLATALSYLTADKHLGFVTRRTRVGQEDDIYDFDASREARIARLRQTMMLPLFPAGAHRFLVVDDVVTFGDTLVCVERLVLEASPGSTLSFACFAADVDRVAAANPDILSALTFERRIDNQQTYITFPWNISA